MESCSVVTESISHDSFVFISLKMCVEYLSAPKYLSNKSSQLLRVPTKYDNLFFTIGPSDTADTEATSSDTVCSNLFLLPLRSFTSITDESRPSYCVGMYPL